LVKKFLMLLCFCACILLGACSSSKDKTDNHCASNQFPSLDSTCSLVHDIPAEIVAINGEDQETATTKPHQPMVTNVVLFRVQGTDYYFKLAEGAGTSDLQDMGDAWIYNHKIGDVVNFKYLRKDRFFEIKQ